MSSTRTEVSYYERHAGRDHCTALEIAVGVAIGTFGYWFVRWLIA